MNNLEKYAIVTDRESQVQYHIYSHRELTPQQQASIIGKKSLHSTVGRRKIYDGVGEFEIVKIIAGDGWEEA